MKCACAILSSLACSVVPIFFHIFLINGVIFEKKKVNKHKMCVAFIVSPCIFVQLVFSPTYALVYIIKILSQAVTLIAHITPTCFDPYRSSSGSISGPCQVTD